MSFYHGVFHVQGEKLVPPGDFVDNWEFFQTSIINVAIKKIRRQFGSEFKDTWHDIVQE